MKHALASALAIVLLFGLSLGAFAQGVGIIGGGDGQQATPSQSPEPSAPAQASPAPSQPGDASPSPGEGQSLIAPAKETTMRYFIKGDSELAINLGVGFPLFILDPNTGISVSPLFSGNMNVGADFFINYDYFVADSFAIGGSLGGFLAGVADGRVLAMVPVMFRMTYMFQAIPWEFPLTLSLGGVFSTASTDSKFDPIISPSLGVYYRYNASWSFGGQLSFWLVPQWYSDPNTAWNRLFGSLEITIGAMAHL
jgi:hypothetical protein